MNKYQELVNNWKSISVEIGSQSKSPRIVAICDTFNGCAAQLESVIHADSAIKVGDTVGFVSQDKAQKGTVRAVGFQCCEVAVNGTVVLVRESKVSKISTADAVPLPSGVGVEIEPGGSLRSEGGLPIESESIPARCPHCEASVLTQSAQDIKDGLWQYGCGTIGGTKTLPEDEPISRECFKRTANHGTGICAGGIALSSLRGGFA